MAVIPTGAALLRLPAVQVLAFDADSVALWMGPTN